MAVTRTSTWRVPCEAPGTCSLAAAVRSPAPLGSGHVLCGAAEPRSVPGPRCPRPAGPSARRPLQAAFPEAGGALRREGPRLPRAPRPRGTPCETRGRDAARSARLRRSRNQTCLRGPAPVAAHTHGGEGFAETRTQNGTLLLCPLWPLSSSRSALQTAKVIESVPLPSSVCVFGGGGRLPHPNKPFSDIRRGSQNSTQVSHDLPRDRIRFHK